LRRSSVLATIWWALLVGAKLLFWFSVLMELGDLFTIVSPLELFLIALSINIVADGIQIALVRRVALRQTVLERKRLAAVAKAEGAGEPVVDVDELLIRVNRRPDAAVFVGGEFEPRATEAKGPANSQANDEPASSADDESALLLTDEHTADSAEPKP
jgi:hypothetical protein